MSSCKNVGCYETADCRERGGISGERFLRQNHWLWYPEYLEGPEEQSATMWPRKRVRGEMRLERQAVPCCNGPGILHPKSDGKLLFEGRDWQDQVYTKYSSFYRGRVVRTQAEQSQPCATKGRQQLGLGWEGENREENEPEVYQEAKSEMDWRRGQGGRQQELTLLTFFSTFLYWEAKKLRLLSCASQGLILFPERLAF